MTAADACPSIRWTTAGTIGQTSVVPDELEGANLTENAAKITDLDDLILPEYLQMYLDAPHVQMQIEDLSKATTQAKLALHRIETIEVPVVPIEEQMEVMRTLGSSQEHRSSLLASIDKAQTLVNTLRRSILHAAFTGQLVE